LFGKAYNPAMGRRERRFRCCRLRYATKRSELSLSRDEFAALFEKVLVEVKASLGTEWLAVCTAGCGGDTGTEYEVLVHFAKRTRLSSTSARLKLPKELWLESVEAQPRWGKSRKEFFRDEMDRWTVSGRKKSVFFGTGLTQLSAKVPEVVGACAERQASCARSGVGQQAAGQRWSEQVRHKAERLLWMKRMLSAAENMLEHALDVQRGALHSPEGSVGGEAE
jgi:hypothetical protein